MDDLKLTYWLILSVAECVVMGPWETVPIPQLFWMAWCGNPWFGLLRCFLLLVSLNNILFLKLHFQIYICFAFVSEVTSRCRNSTCRNKACRNIACTPYLVTGALITSELKFMADYRTLRLSNPRIIDT